MYNPTEQIAEFNKTNVAQATKFAATLARERREVLEVQPGRREGGVRPVRRRRASRSPRSRTCRNCSRCAPSSRKRKCKPPSATRVTCTSWRRKRKPSISALAEEAFGVLPEGRGRVGRQGQQVGAGRFGRGRQRVQVDDRRDDRRVRPVPEGVEASREPRRRERPRCRGERDQATSRARRPRNRPLGKRAGASPHRRATLTGSGRGLEKSPAVPTSIAMSPSVSIPPPD